MQDRKKRSIKCSSVIHEATAAHPDNEPKQLAEEIRKRAYEIFIERGDSPGDQLGDWLRAEQEINARPPKPAFKGR
jgi:hypothetical protein